jgi:type IV secretion system protein VirB9
MTVVTDRHTYLFELRSSAGARPLYLLRFAYAPDPSPPRPFPRRKRQA